MSIMILPPYKIAFRRYLKDLISKAEPFDSILDCASAGDKFLFFFRHKKYTGADISLELIISTKKRHHGSAYQFFHADLEKNNWELNGKKFDLVVSTHTLSHISFDKKAIAISNLVGAVREDGSFILEVTAADLDLAKEILDKEMVLSEEIAYRGSVTRRFGEILTSFNSSKNESLKKGLQRLSNFLSLFDFIGKKGDYLLLYRKPQ